MRILLDKMMDNHTEIDTKSEQIPDKNQFRGLPAFVAIKISTKMDSQQVVSNLLKIHDIEDVFEVTGEFDIIVIVRAKTSSNLHNSIKAIRMISGVMDTHSYLALGEHSKEDLKK